jgi:phosphohistidine phosphatase SixA
VEFNSLWLSCWPDGAMRAWLHAVSGVGRVSGVSRAHEPGVSSAVLTLSGRPQSMLCMSGTMQACWASG